MNSYKRARADIASLVDWLECELEKFDTRDDLNWATIGTLGHVRKNLVETLAFLSGFEESEIQRSLDELHS